MEVVSPLYNRLRGPILLSYQFRALTNTSALRLGYRCSDALCLHDTLQPRIAVPNQYIDMFFSSSVFTWVHPAEDVPCTRPWRAW